MLCKVTIIGSVLIFFISASCASSGESIKKDGETVILKGIVRVVGNEPFPRLVLTVQCTNSGKTQNDYVIRGPLEKIISDQYQGRIIVVEGRYCREKVPEQPLCIEPENIIKVE